MIEPNSAWLACRAALCRESTGAHLELCDAFAHFLAGHLSVEDFIEAASLLHAAINPAHAVRRQRKTATNPEPPAAA
jgi:hypothetical protein